MAPRARILLPIFLALLIAFSFLRLCHDAPPRAVHEFAGEAMGTTWSVKLVAPDLAPAAQSRAREAVLERLSAVNRLMSTYDPESELSRFNRLASTEPFAVSREMLEVLRVAREVSALSGGAFDVTVGPLVAAWGFGATARAPAPPDARELAAARERVGWRRLAVDLESGTVAKSHPGTECDLSGVAKGYAVDEVARALLGLGHGDFLVELGGELRAHGQREGGGPWRVAIERPDVARRAIHRVVPLADRSLATSGDYRSYYERDGVRLSHLIDPRSARPVTHALASVSVIHPSAAWADALATAVGVLGPEEGLALATRHGWAAYLILRERGGALRGVATPAFEALVGPAEDRPG